MKMSRLFVQTLREFPSDAEVMSHKLLVRAGYIRKLAQGVYNYLPLMWRVLKKVENIVREEMDAAGAQEMLMPFVQPEELWQESGRWEVYGKELMRLKDRHNRGMCLGPTHEEVITAVAREGIKSYKQLPVNLYQIQSKFRDEVRPRYGLLRGREFIMKDAYSFDSSQEGLEKSYADMAEAYYKIFERCELETKANGLYLDHYQGDCKIGPVAIGGFSPLEKTYSYNPVPDTLVAMGKENFIKGLQGNVWSEYLYTNDIREYRTFPRALAIAETGWTATELKDYNDFIRRIDNACVRLDGHGINYYIPMPEQPNGSCDFVAFTDNVSLTFTTNRPVKMVYTLDGTEPTINSTVYNAPLDFTENATVKIASVLPSNKMSKVRTVTIEKQTLSPAATVEKKTPGLNMEVIDGTYLNMAELEKSGMKVADKKVIKDTRELITYRKFSEETMRGFKQYSAIATGYVDIPADGVYFFSSDLEEVWIDGKKLIDNGGLVKHFCPTNKSVALSAGLHEFKVVFLGNSYGGYPTHWNDGSINIRKSDEESFKKIKPESLFH